MKLKNIDFKLFIAGFLSILASPPINLFFVLFFSISYFFNAVYKAKNIRESVKISLTFGFGYYLANVHWISFSLFEDMRFIILLPIALAIIPFYFALFLALTTGFYKFLEGKISNNLMKIFSFCILWVIHEKLRSSLIFPFPWWPIGMSLSSIDEWIQPLSIIGMGLFSFCTILLYLSPIIARIHAIKWQKFCALLFIFLIHSSFLLFGKARLDKAPKIQETNPFNIVIIQTNFTQYQKFEDVELSIKTHYNLTKKALDEAHKNGKKTLVVWPETSTPYPLYKNLNINKDRLLTSVKSLLKDGDYLVFGGILQDETDYMNSAFLMNNTGILSSYEKINLVPFGEYVPFLPIKSSFLPSMKAGNERKKWEIFDKNFVPLICYEVLFDKNIKKMHPDFIINISNDGWFSRSIGPHQHLAHAKILAIKNNASVIRVANTGTSAIIDKHGKILVSIDRHEEGFEIF